MEENEHDEVVESQEDTTETEEVELETVEDDSQDDSEGDDTISISKSELTKLKRKAFAYDSTKKTAKTQTVQEPAISSERLERLELKADGYSTDEIDEIMELGGQKVLNTKIVQSAIKTMRAEKKSKDASTDVSSKSPVYKKFSQEDISKMSAKELEKILTE